jgi:hypothetical protein
MVANESARLPLTDAPVHDARVSDSHGNLLELRIDGPGLEKNDALGGVDVLGRHGGEHGNAGSAKDDVAVVYLALAAAMAIISRKV